MNCLHPRILSIPGRVGMQVPCGRCINCRIQRAREWAVRGMHELEYWDRSSFATLTYDDDHLPSSMSISRKELQDYFKRLRRELEPSRLSYIASGEYGGKTGRPHYHAILYGVDNADVISSAWCRGQVNIGTVTMESIRYVCGYTLKAKGPPGPGREIPFQLFSHRLGRRWAMDHAELLHDTGGIRDGKVLRGIPRYYRDVLGLSTDRLAALRDYDEYELEERRARVSLNGGDDAWIEYARWLRATREERARGAQALRDSRRGL